MLDRLLSKVPHFTIADPSGPYLTRYYLFRRSWLPDFAPLNKLPSVFLHYFHRGDNDRELHNHGWLFSVSLILSGGYIEERLDGDTTVTRVFGPGSINVIGKDDFHRVDLINPAAGCWSLFFAGFGGKPSGDDWSFLDPVTKKTTPWREFVSNRWK